MWETRTAGVWAVTAVAPSSINNVYIQNGHTVTVDVANGYCNDIQLNIGGVLAIGTNIVNVNGKIRAFTTTLGAVTGTIDGTFYSDQISSTATAATMITTSIPGVLKFVGNTRNITNTGEWNSSGTSNAAEFALTAGQTGTLVVGVKFKPITFSSGIITTGDFISASTGDVSIKNGARLISSRSSAAVIGNSSTVVCGIVTIETGGVLELTGSAPLMNCTAFTNNGTVIYSKAGSQTLLSSGSAAYAIPGTTAYNDYSTLILSGSGGKSIFASINVSNLLKVEGTTTQIASASLSATKTITMLNGSTIEKATPGTNTILSSAASAFVYYGTAPTDVVNLVISATCTNSGELRADPVPGPGKIGTLTVNSGVTYSISGGRTVTNIVNNGIIALAPSTSMTLIVSGTLSGLGTFSSILSTTNTPNYFSGSLDFQGAGPIGTLYMTPGAKEIRNLGINGNLTLGNAIQLNGNLTLTAGTLTNSGSLTLLNAATPIVNNTINRSAGTLDAAPIFGSAINVNYSGSNAKTASFEMPSSSTLLNNLTNSTGVVTLNGATKVNGLLTLTSGTITTSSNNLTLVSAPVITTGTIDASNAGATITFENPLAVVLPALPLFTGNVQNLTINGAGGVTLGSATSVAGKLTLTSGTLATGGLLTLKSGDCCTSATVAPVTGGSVSGNVIVERNIPAGFRAYRLLSSPVTTAGTIQANWQEGGTGNPFPGFGTHITGTGTGFDATTSNASSLFTHNNASPSWIAATNTDITTLVAGSPYLIYIRGSRLGTNITSITNDVTTLRGTGTLITGTIPVSGLNATANGFSLVGNPYQAQVDMGAVLSASTNLNTGFYYILEPKMGTKGTYVTVNTATGSNNSSGGSTANQYLQPWQACFVQTVADGAASLSFLETNKFEGTQTSVFRKANTISRLSLALYDTAKLAQNGYPLDGVVVDFNASESNAVNQNDASKMTNFDENMATFNSSKLLSIESRAIPTDTDEIPLNITKYKGTSYTIKAEGTGLTGPTPYLFDQFANTTTEIPQDGSVNYDYTVDSANPASAAADRFKLIYAKTLKTIDNAVEGFALYPNPSKVNSFSVVVPQSMSKASLSVSNLLGQQLYSQSDLQSGATAKVTVSNVKTAGVYLVRLTSEGKTVTTKWIVE
nr:T9SS type A sorting domain-containing protein [uncultured Flavobacterium sp.]